MAEKAKKEKIVHEAGKRKRALARATISEGKGIVRINSILLNAYRDGMAQMRVKEPLMIAAPILEIDKIDIKVNVEGGGWSGQIDAVRTAIARALVSYAAKQKKDAELREKLVEYDRTLISGDSRRTEPHKPSKSSQGPRAKRQKSYR